MAILDYKSVDNNSNIVIEDADFTECYDVNYLDNFGSHRHTFTFGGPGCICDVWSFFWDVSSHFNIIYTRVGVRAKRG